MQRDSEKKTKMLETLIRARDVKLEKAHHESQKAKAAFSKAQTALSQSTEEVESLNTLIKQSLNGGETLLLGRLESAKHYLEVKRREQLGYFHECLSAKQVVDRAADELKNHQVQKKGLERMLGRRKNALAKEGYKRDLIKGDEAWLRKWSTEK